MKKQLSKIMAMVACMLMLVTNVAYAAKPCCCFAMKDTVMTMQVMQDMPCHSDNVASQESSVEKPEEASVQCCNCDGLPVAGLSIVISTSVDAPTTQYDAELTMRLPQPPVQILYSPPKTSFLFI